MRKIILAIASIVGAMAIYFVFNPANSVAAPKCIFRLATGYDCPSCGVQRAIHSLLHLDLYHAFWYNPFLFIVAPYFILLLAVSLCKSRYTKRLRPYVQHRYVVYAYIALYFIWWVVRNTKWWSMIASVS